MLPLQASLGTPPAYADHTPNRACNVAEKLRTFLTTTYNDLTASGDRYLISAKEENSVMANEEGRLRFVNQEYLPGYSDIEADYIYCLDLTTLNRDAARNWITEAQYIHTKNDLAKVPMIVVMGTFTQLSNHGSSLVEVGAILWEKPDEFDDLEDDQKRAILESEFSYAEKESEGERHEWVDEDGDWLISKSLDETNERENQDFTEPHPHHRIYVDPPHQLDSRDFERLIGRMRMPDDDPRKDD